MELFIKKFFPHQPDIATREHLEARFDEWRKDQKEKYSSPAPLWIKLPDSSRQGYSPTIWKGVEYLIRRNDSLTETVLIDQQGRLKEYWQNWDSPGKVRKRWEYDTEGYVRTAEELHRTGYGDAISIHYQTDELGHFLSLPNGNRIPEELIIQHYLGDPIASWSPRTIVRGNNIDEPIHIGLLDVVLPTLGLIS